MDIATTIESLQELTRQAMYRSEDCLVQASRAVEQVRLADHRLISITQSVSLIEQMNQQIAAAVTQQSAVAEQVSRSVVKVRDDAQASAAKASESIGFGYSDPAMEESLYETTILRQFAGLHLDRIPDETTILNFRRLLEKHELAGGILQVINGYLGDRGLMLRQGTVVDATIIHAPSSTKNKDGKRDPEMHQTKKGNQYFFGMKAHIGVDAESGLVHSLVGTAANVADVTQVDQLLHGEETYVCGDAGYTGVEKRAEHQNRTMIWSIAARPSSYRKHGKKSLIGRMRRKIEYAKAQVRAKVEHPFRVIKRQFGYTKVRFRGLSKNIAQQTTLFALSNLWMVRKRLLNAGEVRL